MELRHLRYFAAVARHMSFSKAAEELHISQPPLSRQIMELERELGASLFDRRAKGIELTKAGEYLKIEAQRILDSVDMVARTVKVISDPKAKILRVGCVSFLMYSTLPPFLEIVKEQAPDIRLELSIMSTEGQEKAIRSGAIDIGFVRSWMDDEELVFEPLSEERFAVIYPSCTEVETDPARCIEGLRDSAFIAVSETTSPGLAEKVKSVCEEYGCVPNVGYVCSDAYSIIKLVSTGLGWSIVPDLAYRDAAIADVSIVMLPQTMLLGLCYAKPALSEGEKRFIELAKAFFSNRLRDAKA
jgi:LysR family transcriptional regulator, benzoate and cis,cis-muconate-responsive activator of ben and cat genes